MEKEILVEQKDILVAINDLLNDVIMKKRKKLNDELFHHGTSYNVAPSIIRNGILTINDLQRKGIRNFSDDELEYYNNYFHVNGTDCVSLAKRKIEVGEDFFESWCFDNIDFLIDKKIPVSQEFVSYCNEFIHKGSISFRKVKAIDIRLRKMIDYYKKFPSSYLLNSIINDYNLLSVIAKELIKLEREPYLREMSDEAGTLINISKTAGLPRIKIK